MVCDRVVNMAVYRRNQNGLVTVFFTVASAVILGFVGLAIDTGFAYGDYRQAQLAADAEPSLLLKNTTDTAPMIFRNMVQVR